jgi:hypothetical protein
MTDNNGAVERAITVTGGIFAWRRLLAALSSPPASVFLVEFGFAAEDPDLSPRAADAVARIDARLGPRAELAELPPDTFARTSAAALQSALDAFSPHQRDVLLQLGGATEADRAKAFAWSTVMQRIAASISQAHPPLGPKCSEDLASWAAADKALWRRLADAIDGWSKAESPPADVRESVESSLGDQLRSVQFEALRSQMRKWPTTDRQTIIGLAEQYATELGIADSLGG